MITARTFYANISNSIINNKHIITFVSPFLFSFSILPDLLILNINLGTLFSLLVVFQLLFVALYLFTNKKGSKRNNRLLSLLFLMFAINLLDFSARVSGIMFSVPLLHLADDCFFFLYGPILYFYTQAVVFRDFTFRKKDIWHLAPFILFASYFFVQLFSVDHETQVEFAKKVIDADLPIWVLPLGMVIYLQILTYLWLSWDIIKKFQTAIKDEFSSIEEINLDWLKFIIRSLFGITAVAMINSVMPLLDERLFLYLTIMILLIFSFYFINAVLIKALNQPLIFSGIIKEEAEKYAGSNLSWKEIETYQNQLISLMETDRPYLDQNLKSADLAAKLGISSKTLSQVVNQSFRQNFFDFINTYRSEEVKRLLRNPKEKITITEAMYHAGFNSKSSFNKEFKKLTGQTPSEFKKSLSEM